MFILLIITLVSSRPLTNDETLNYIKDLATSIQQTYNAQEETLALLNKTIEKIDKEYLENTYMQISEPEKQAVAEYHNILNQITMKELRRKVANETHILQYNETNISHPVYDALQAFDNEIKTELVSYRNYLINQARKIQYGNKDDWKDNKILDVDPSSTLLDIHSK